MAALRPQQQGLRAQQQADAENAAPRKGLKAQAPPQQRRPALVALDQNRPAAAAPARSAKGAGGVRPPVRQFRAISVYEDREERPKQETTTATNKQQQQKLPLSVLSLPSSQTSAKDEREDAEDVESLDASMRSEPSAGDGEAATRARASTLREQFFYVALYREEIYKYMREIEVQKKYRARPDYMPKQSDITHSMRSILVDWLVEVSEEYRLQSETLYLAVSYIDRFLSIMAVNRTKLQLVGTTAMFIASKFEEIYPPELREFVYITDETYTKEQVLRMEHLMLKVLSFDLAPPTPLAFVSLFCIANGLSQRTLYLAMYISELSLLEAEPYLMYPASVLGASALAVARHALLCCHCGAEEKSSDDAESNSSAASCAQATWPDALRRSSGYELADLEGCARSMARTHANAAAQPHQAIVEKYKSNKYDGVAHIEPKSMYPKASAKNLPSLPHNRATPAISETVNKSEQQSR